MDYIWNQSNHQVRFEKLDIDRKAGLILVLSMIIIISALIILLYCETRNSPSPGIITLKEGLSESFHGLVDSIYYEEQNHNTEVWVLSSGYKYETWWSYTVSVGDSVSKMRGDSRIFVYKKDGATKTFDYRILAKRMDSLNN